MRRMERIDPAAARPSEPPRPDDVFGYVPGESLSEGAGLLGWWLTEGVAKVFSRAGATGLV